MPDFLAAADGVTLVLDEQEAAVLRGLLGEMRDLLSHRSSSDPVVTRLYPKAYLEPDDQAAYEDLVGDELHRHKVQALDEVRSSLGDEGGVRAEITGERLGLWLSLLTDLRLAIGTRLGVTEETMGADLDPSDPSTPALSVLHWLGWIQEGMLRVVM